MAVTPLLNVREELRDIVEYIAENKNITIDGACYDLNIGGWVLNN